ncbi:MAG: helix-turn-helix domain-containing protein [Phycisphaerales bacterium]|nr:helix-turn-helix domain-containing protein [Phycisphaerales bacterium]
MQTVGVLIRHRRNQLGLTLQQVADAAECTKSYLSTIENDRRAHPPSEELLARLERALHLDQGHLVDIGRWSRTPSSVRRHVQTAQLQHARARRLIDLLRDRGSDLDTLHSSGELAVLVDAFDSNVELSEPILEQVPLINNVAAGYPVEFTDLDYPARAADEYITCPGVADPQAFAARVIGDSMLPAYREGDIVIFSPEKPTPPGCDCFVRLELDHETTFKRIYFEPDADGEADLMIRLQPLNPAYPPRTLHREQIGGLYAAAFVMRAIG